MKAFWLQHQTNTGERQRSTEVSENRRKMRRKSSWLEVHREKGPCLGSCL